jgi:SAM-dependent methyltransferase
MNNAIRLRELDGLTPGRLLDVGCGKGRFLAAAQAAGWHGVGVEFSAASAEMARATNHIDVVVGDFLTVPIDEHFDAITMWHVLEHLPDPRAAVERAASLLQPGGRLVISVPNSRSLQARIGGDRWFHLDLPRHTYHFTPNALRRMVERSGLAVERIGFFYPEMEAMGLIQTSLNLAGLEGERLYRFAKRDPSVAVDGRLVASMALAAAVSPAALAWSFVAPALGTGASMQLVAQRPAS